MHAEDFLKRHPETRDADGKLIRQLDGITLAVIVEALHEAYGWDTLSRRIPIQCFTSDPSVKSSLTFLRRTPWARKKVEMLYVAMRSAEALGLARP